MSHILLGIAGSPQALGREADARSMQPNGEASSIATDALVGSGGELSSGPARDDGALRLAELAQEPTVERAVEAVREFLGVDVAFTAQISAGKQVCEVLSGADSFGMHPGMGLPLEATYCQRVLDGRLPNVIPDVRADERAASLPITEALNVGAFVSVPLRFSNGELYGTLCAASHQARPDLGYRELQFLRVFARMVSDTLERKQLQQGVLDSQLQQASITTLMAALDARDSYTGEHSEAVVDHAIAVAEQLGLSETEVSEVRQVALLHDIGKIAIPDAILNKNGPLTDSEWTVMRTHPVRSAALVAAVPGLAHLATAVRAEHERWDGKGYPDGLKGQQIPLASRITFVCDAYHAMTSDRPYRIALSTAQACTEIADGSGSQFCPDTAHAFLEIMSPESRQ
jgi:response regulator RpfG family c-di-GMP phosphodiesterase